MTLKELRDKIDEIIKTKPRFADCERIGTIIDIDKETGFVEMEWLEDIREICCDGHGMAAFQLVMQDDKYFFNNI